MNNTTFLDKNQWFSQINNVFFSLTSKEKFWKIENNNPTLRHSVCNNTQDRCPLKIDTALTLNPTPQKNRTQIYEKSYKEWEWVRKILEERNLEPKELKKALQQIKEKIPIFSIEIDGKIRHFEGRAKGTPRYEKQKAIQARDYIQNHCDGNWEIYFLTTTCDPKKYKSRADAWENYDTQELGNVLENLRKHYGCEYIRVLESFKNGYPHAHCLLFFPKGTYEKYEILENKKKVTDGKIFEWIKSNIKSKVFDFEIAKGNGVSSYLTKYLTKASKENIFSLINTKWSNAGTEKKLIQELVYIKAFRKRTLASCKDRSLAAEEKRKEEKKVSVLIAEKQKEKQKEFLSQIEKETNVYTQIRTYLTKLCTNSPLTCKSCIKQVNFSTYEKQFGGFPQRNKELSKKDDEIFNKGSNFIGCSGCFYSEFVQFVLNPTESVLNRPFKWSADKRTWSYFIDGYNLENDEEWVKCVTNLVTFYFKNCLCRFDTLEELVENKENISHKTQWWTKNHNIKIIENEEKREFVNNVYTYRTGK